MKNKQNNYVYQEEDFNVEDLLKISNNSEEIVKNDIDNLFAEIVEYKQKRGNDYMNMQAMLKQAQKLQKDMMKAQEEIYGMTFEGRSSFVTVKVNGKKELLEVNIDSEGLDKEEVEMLQDMIVVAINDAFKKVDKTTEDKMGPYTKGMPGLF